MKIITKINNIPINLLAVCAFVGVVMVLNIFSSTTSVAEVAVAPNSYVTTDADDENIQENGHTEVNVVSGQPKEVNGKKVKYKTSKVIPISPKIETENGTKIAVPVNKPCFPKSDKDCGKVSR